MNPGDVSMAPYDKQSPFHTGYGMPQDGPCCGFFVGCERVGSGINLCFFSKLPVVLNWEGLHFQPQMVSHKFKVMTS